MSGNLTSSVTSIQWMDNIGVQLVWTGSPVGNFFVDVSADYDANTNNPGNWTPIALSPAPTTAAGSPIYIDMNQLSAPFIRVRYVSTSGSGTLTATITGKML